MQRRTFVSSSLAACVPLAGWAQAGGLPQTALVVGNDNYTQLPRLANAGNDARLMHATLQKLGVQSRLWTDLDTAAFSQKIDAFVKSVQGFAGVVWVYYAGHGVQMDGQNYLIGTQARMGSPDEVAKSNYRLDALLARLDQSQAQAVVVVVDACRNNPFKSAPSATRGIVAQGLVPPRATHPTSDRAGMLIAYATAPYTESADWPQAANGPYTSALCRALLAKPYALEEALRATSKEVWQSTGKKQVPWFHSSLRSEIWLTHTAVSLRPLAASSPAGARPPAGPGRSFRADMQHDSAYASTPASDWAALVAQLEAQAPRMDRQEVRSALARAARPAASDFDRTLAGLLLEQGQGTEKNRALAATRYTAAAQRGYVPAQTLLGELAYARGNYADAYKWSAEAAQSGYGRPQLNLAQLSLAGQGTHQDAAAAQRMLLEVFKNLIPSPTQGH